MIDRAKFFNDVRLNLFGKMNAKQVMGMSAILDEWEWRRLKDLRWLAYMLATTFHETDRTMQPIREYGRGKGKKYGKIYYGRGFVQLTWDFNYRRMGQLLKRDLLRSPDLALQPSVATEIMFEGMLRAESFKGDFTGKSLEDYFNDEKDDPVNARRIINGTDKASLIAGYHRKFLTALRS